MFSSRLAATKLDIGMASNGVKVHIICTLSEYRSEMTDHFIAIKLLHRLIVVLRLFVLILLLIYLHLPESYQAYSQLACTFSLFVHLQIVPELIKTGVRTY